MEHMPSRLPLNEGDLPAGRPVGEMGAGLRFSQHSLSTWHCRAAHTDGGEPALLSKSASAQEPCAPRA